MEIPTTSATWRSVISCIILSKLTGKIQVAYTISPMDYGFTDIVRLLGSLGLFLFGMKVMSDALLLKKAESIRTRHVKDYEGANE